MAVVKKISELTAKGSDIGANDLVIVGVSNGTDYDLKSVTGNQLVGAAVSQTITNGVTTTAPSQNAVFDALALKVDVVAGSRLITSSEATSIADIANKAPLASPTFTGTVTLPSDTAIGTVSATEIGYLDGVTQGIQSQINAKVNLNTLITPSTGTKVTYDAKGLILSSTNITTSDVSGLGTLATQNGTFSGTSSGTNTGDQTYFDARVQSVSSSATVTPTSLNDLVKITAQATGLTLANPTGTFTEGQALMIRIKDNGTARAITFDTNYRAIGITLPTTTVISKTMYLGIIYNATDAKWDIIGYNIQA
jgi:hypothetical protein